MGRDKHRLIPVKYDEMHEKSNEERIETASKLISHGVNYLLIVALFYTIYRFGRGNPGGKSN